jgi:hypothetical protein
VLPGYHYREKWGIILFVLFAIAILLTPAYPPRSALHLALLYPSSAAITHLIICAMGASRLECGLTRCLGFLIAITRHLNLVMMILWLSIARL